MKKMQVVKNSKGEILATAEFAQGNDIPVSVELEQGEKLEEIELPDNYVIDEMKKMQVVRNSKREILATVEFAQGDDIPVSVELEESQESEELEVPGSYILALEPFFKEHGH